MPNHETYLSARKGEALLNMLADDGATAAGQLPPTEHAAAVQEAEKMSEVQDVVDAHANGNQPPNVGGGGN